MSLDTMLEPLLRSPRLPEIAEALQARLQQEAAARQRFYEEITEEQKAEFIEGEVILHSPARCAHLRVQQKIESLLDAYVRTRALGEILGGKCLCVFPRNDYEPDVVFFGPSKVARLTPGTMKFPIPDLVAVVLSESTTARDRGVKFDDFALHGVAEYSIVDAEEGCIEQYLNRGDRFE